MQRYAGDWTNRPRSTELSLSFGFYPANPKVPDVRPEIVYHGEGVDGKNTAHGLEQHGFGENVKNYGRDKLIIDKLL